MEPWQVERLLRNKVVTPMDLAQILPDKKDEIETPDWSPSLPSCDGVDPNTVMNFSEFAAYASTDEMMGRKWNKVNEALFRDWCEKRHQMSKDPRTACQDSYFGKYNRTLSEWKISYGTWILCMVEADG